MPGRPRPSPRPGDDTTATFTAASTPLATPARATARDAQEDGEQHRHAHPLGPRAAASASPRTLRTGARPEGPRTARTPCAWSPYNLRSGDSDGCPPMALEPPTTATVSTPGCSASTNRLASASAKSLGNTRGRREQRACSTGTGRAPAPSSPRDAEAATLTRKGIRHTRRAQREGLVAFTPRRTGRPRIPSSSMARLMCSETSIRDSNPQG